MPASMWTIDYEDGGPNGTKLLDCQVSQTATQTSLLAPDGSNLGTANSVTPNITFENFSVPGSDLKFSLTITSFTYGPNNDQAHGSWAIADDPQKVAEVAEEGSWTAQAGVGEPKGESAASADAS